MPDLAEKTIVDLALDQGLLPANHMTVWGKLKRLQPGLQPAAVWRALGNDPRVRFDGTTDRWLLNPKGG